VVIIFSVVKDDSNMKMQKHHTSAGSPPSRAASSIGDKQSISIPRFLSKITTFGQKNN
jgi:hypothetical protein